jgi:hypothetical protein
MKAERSGWKRSQMATTNVLVTALVTSNARPTHDSDHQPGTIAFLRAYLKRCTFCPHFYECNVGPVQANNIEHDFICEETPRKS